MSRLVPLVYAASILLASGIVRAHSDPAMFAEPTELGGSGGRYFTGSPQDGLGCSVCHSGGTVPRVVLEGLPTAYEPGTRAMVTVSWEQPEVSHADALPAETRCDGDPEGAPAAWLVELSPRRVLVVQDCGARAVSFAFTAPEARALSFAAAVVRSDSSATAQGDGVLEVRETIWRDGAQPSGCALGLSPSPGPMALLLALLFVRRRRGLSGIRRRTWR
jgi:hypothetical protein